MGSDEVNCKYSMIIDVMEEKQEDNDKTNQNATSSTFQSICNLAGMEGMTLLAMPYIIQIGGLTAVIVLTIVPVICLYCGMILIQCLYVKNSRGQNIRVRRNYRDLAEECWPKYGGYIAALLQSMYILFAGSSNVVLCGSILYGLLPAFQIPKRLWMVIAGILGFPTLFIKDFSQVALSSLVSYIALIITMVIVLGYGLSNYNGGSLNEMPPKGSLIAFNVIVFGFACQPYLPTVEADMKTPSKFNFVLGITCIPCFLLKLIFGLIGFVVYYPNLDQVITNSISLVPIKILVSCLIFINVGCSYPFVVKGLVHCIEDSIANEIIRARLHTPQWFIIIRFIVSLSTIVPAITIPYFALIMSFITSLLIMVEDFILPCVFHLCLKSKDLRWYHKWIDYSIILFGIVVGIAGLIVSSFDVIKSFD